MNNYPINTRQKISRVSNEGANEISTRLERIQGLAEAVARIAAGEIINLESLHQRLLSDDTYTNSNFGGKVKRFEIELIVDALVKTGGRQNHAAKLLGMKVTTLNAKIKRYKIPIGQAATAQIKNFVAVGAK